MHAAAPARGALEPAAARARARRRRGHELAPELGVVQVDVAAADLVGLRREGRLGEGAARAAVGRVVRHLVPLREELLDVGLAEGAARLVALGVLAHDIVRTIAQQVDHLACRWRLVALVAAALVAAEQRLVEAELLARALEHAPLVGAVGDEPVDLHLLRLADAVAARHALHVVLRVPVAVEDDDGVGRGEVDAHAARARREQEGEGVRGVALLEAVDGRLPHAARHAAVEPLVRQPRQVQVVLEDVEHARELREDEQLAPLRAQPRQQLVQQHHLAARLDQLRERLGLGRRAHRQRRVALVEQPRVVAQLAQLHADVAHRRQVGLAALAARPAARERRQQRAVAVEQRAVLQ